MKKNFLVVFLVTYVYEIRPQYNVLQSIDFDSQQRVVYGLTGNYDYSYAMRYKDGYLETWNLTQLFNLPFFWISTTVDEDDNIWAFLTTKIYKFDGNNWNEFEAPDIRYKYSDLIFDNNNNLWLTDWGTKGAHRFNLIDTTWTIFDSLTSEYSFPGIITISGDSTWIPTSEGLVLIFNDGVSVVLDTLNSNIPSQKLFCFFINSINERWLGSYDAGLIKWINDSTFISYNTSNSNLPHNFVNAIDQDSKGNLWLATDGGFACLKNDTIISYSHLLDEPIITLKVDHLDRIWFGELGTGNLLMFDGSNIIIVTSVSVDDIMVKYFTLFQNYPNPFNPTTNIQYTVSSLPDGEAGRQFITLKVYDVLGNEIVTLVNEEKQPGSYEVEFDGEKLPSGIYFYQLNVGGPETSSGQGFIETKKMVLLK